MTHALPTRRQWLATTAALVSAPALHAQGLGGRPLKVLVAYPPGGVSDVVARALAEALAPRLGQPVVVENRAGAAGTLAVQAVAKAAPDGQTLVFAAFSPLTLSPYLARCPTTRSRTWCRWPA